jgi:hypothetical protein
MHDPWTESAARDSTESAQSTELTVDRPILEAMGERVKQARRGRHAFGLVLLEIARTAPLDPDSELSKESLVRAFRDAFDAHASFALGRNAVAVLMITDDSVVERANRVHARLRAWRSTHHFVMGVVEHDDPTASTR